MGGYFFCISSLLDFISCTWSLPGNVSISFLRFSLSSRLGVCPKAIFASLAFYLRGRALVRSSFPSCPDPFSEGYFFACQFVFETFLFFFVLTPRSRPLALTLSRRRAGSVFIPIPSLACPSPSLFLVLAWAPDCAA